MLLNVRNLQLAVAVVCVLSLGGARAALASDGTAFTGRLPTQEELDFIDGQKSTAKAYAACLLDVAENKNADAGSCGVERQAYEQHLAKDISALALGCLEESVIGAPLSAENTCASLRSRFPFVLSHVNDEEGRP